MLRRFSGQTPERLLITDQSQKLLAVAQTQHHADHAEYLSLDIQQAFPLDAASFDLSLASMLLNELTTSGLQNALQECARVLRPGSRLLAAVPHPVFIYALAKKGALTDFGRGLFAMPSAEGLRLPVSRRPMQAYLEALDATGITVETEDVFPDEKTLHEKPGLKLPRETPLALLRDCQLTALNEAQKGCHASFNGSVRSIRSATSGRCGRAPRPTPGRGWRHWRLPRRRPASRPGSSDRTRTAR